MVPGSKEKKSDNKTTQRFGYTEEALRNALSDTCGNVSRIREAKYEIPRPTVQNRLSGYTDEQKRKVGPDPRFGLKGEKKMVDWIIGLAKSGIRKVGGPSGNKTKLNNLSYIEVQMSHLHNSVYNLSELCEGAHNARRDVLKTFYIQY